MIQSSITEQFEKAYKRMPAVFSSNAFCDRLRLQGVPQETLSLQYHLNFLIEHTNRLSNRRFEKIVLATPQLDIDLHKPSSEDAINSAIELLKSAGYKIFKTVTFTEEV